MSHYHQCITCTDEFECPVPDEDCDIDMELDQCPDCAAILMNQDN